ncbi:hypothetical protein AB1K70_03335 [Bremerella sp. JC770]|uniref:hypothetical protein n=1 Tax=Bremerella sp. JC770 TaxID=3232137 RepID=UPI00345A47E9
MDEKSILIQAARIDSFADREAFLADVCPENWSSGHIASVLRSLNQVEKSIGQNVSVQGVCDSMAKEQFKFLLPSEYVGSLGRIDHYELVRVFTCYSDLTIGLALDTTLERFVVLVAPAMGLKLSDNAKTRFEKIRSRLAALATPEAAQVVGGGEQLGVPFFAIEIVRGRSLAEVVSSGDALPATQVLSISKDIATSVSVLIENGLSFKEFSPEMISISECKDRAKISQVWHLEPIEEVDSARSSNRVDRDEHRESYEQQIEQDALRHLGGMYYTVLTGSDTGLSATDHVDWRENLYSIVATQHPDIPSEFVELTISLIFPTDPAEVLSMGEVISQLNAISLAPGDLGIDARARRKRKSTTKWRLVRRAASVVLSGSVIYIGLVYFGIIYPHLFSPLMHLTHGTLQVDCDMKDVVFNVYRLDRRGFRFDWQGPFSLSLPRGIYRVEGFQDGKPVYFMRCNVDPRRFTYLHVEVAASLDPRQAVMQMPESTESDRLVATWVLRNGGQVNVQLRDRPGVSLSIWHVDDLPRDRFFIDHMTVANFEAEHLSEFLDRLEGCRFLEEIRFEATDISGVQLRRIAKLKNIRCLELSRVFNASSEDFSALVGLANLRTLSLDYSPHGNLLLDVINEFHALEKLSISDCPIEDEDIKPIATLRSLRRLSLRSRFLTDQAVHHVGQLNQLAECEICSPLLTDQVWQLWARCNSIESIITGKYGALSTEQVLGPEIGELRSLPKLRRLHLRGGSFDEETLLALATLRQLEELRIDSSESREGGFELLRGMSNLRSLTIVNCTIALEIVDYLQRELPDCAIRTSSVTRDLESTR